MDCQHSVDLDSSHPQDMVTRWSFPLGTSTCQYICPGRSNFLGNIFSNNLRPASCTSSVLQRRGKSKRHQKDTGCHHQLSDLSCSTRLSCMQSTCEELHPAELFSFLVVLAVQEDTVSNKLYPPRTVEVQSVPSQSMWWSSSDQYDMEMVPSCQHWDTWSRSGTLAWFPADKRNLARIPPCRIRTWSSSRHPWERCRKK
jgi:hypothetical protein